jgi:hypothetical protein
MKRKYLFIKDQFEIISKYGNVKKYNDLIEKIDNYLPEIYRKHKGIQRFILTIIINESIKEGPTDYKIGYPISRKRLDSEFSTISLIKRNTRTPETNLSILNNLIKESIIYRLPYAPGNCFQYYVLKKFIKDINLRYNIKIYYLKCFKKYFDDLKTKIIDKTKSKDDILKYIFNNSLYKKDNYMIKEKKYITTTAFTESLLNTGKIGINIIPTKFFDIFIKSAFIDVNNWFCKMTNNLSFEQNTDDLDEYIKIYDGAIFKITSILLGTEKSFNNGKILYHKPQLIISKTGRIFQMYGEGLTGLSKNYKALIYKLLAKELNIEINNYDLRASQMSICEHICKPYFKLPYINKYINNPNYKKELAKKINIPVSLLKINLLSLLFGASGKDIYYNGQFNAFAKNFNKYNIYDTIKRKRVLNNFNIVCSGIINEINNYFNKVDDILNKFPTRIKNKKIQISNGIIWVDKDYFNVIKNFKPTNKKKKPTKKELEYNFKQLASAFILQGIESKFIFELINILHETNIKVLSYEYDGLIIIGEIPQKLIDEAKKRVKINNLILEKKSIN